MASQIFAAEVNLEIAPEAARETLRRCEAEIVAQLPHAGLQEYFVLSGRNRFAIYAVGESVYTLGAVLLRHDSFAEYVGFYADTEQAVRHLIATASGLCSRVTGELGVLEELRHSHQQAIEKRTIGYTLDNLLRESIRWGQRIRTQTGIDHYSTSVVDAGFEMIYNNLEDVREKVFLVIGTGEVARRVLGALRHEGIHNVLVAGYPFRTAFDLATQFGARAIQMRSVGQYTPHCDVVVATTCGGIGVTNNGVAIRKELNLSENRTTVLLDFGVPRNFDESLRYRKYTRLYNLEDLKSISDNLFEAFGGTPEAWKMVNREAHRFAGLFNELQASPLNKEFWNTMSVVCKDNNAWLFPENRLRADQSVVRKVIDSISHKPMQKMKLASSVPGATARVCPDVFRESGELEIPFSQN